MGNIKKLNQPLHTNLTVDQVLGDALESDLKDIMVIGYDQDDDLYAVPSRMTKNEALWLIKHVELHVLGIK